MSGKPADLVVDPITEQAVLRVAIAFPDRRRILVRAIGDSEFLTPAHAAIWRTLRALVDGGLEYTPEAARKILSIEGAPPDDEYLSDLEAPGATLANLDWYIETMRWDAMRARVLQGPMPELIKLLEAPKTTIEEVTSAARGLLRAFDGGGGRKHIHRPAELSRAYKADVARRVAEKDTFLSYGWKAMDERLTWGAAPGKTVVVAGLSGSGKSTWVANFVIEQAKLKLQPITLCVWEMGAVDTLDLMICSLTGITIRNLSRGHLSQEDLKRVSAAVDWIVARVRFMENAFYEKISTGKPSNERNLDILEGYIAEGSGGIWIFDLWNKLLVDQNPDAVTRALNRQFEMHKQYRIHGMQIQQLNLKDVEKRPDKRPTRESVKGVGTYVENADMLLGVHRDAQFKRVPDDTVEVICLKQRMGEPNWAVRYNYDGAIARIGECTEVPYDPGLEAADELGDGVGSVAGIKSRATGGRRGTKLGRRDQ